MTWEMPGFSEVGYSLTGCVLIFGLCLVLVPVCTFYFSCTDQSDPLGLYPDFPSPWDPVIFL